MELSLSISVPFLLVISMSFGNPVESPDDKVVGSFNIYLSPKLRSDMHVFQYPLRHGDRPYEADTIKLECTEGLYLNDDGEEPKEANVINPGSRLKLSMEMDTFGSSSFSGSGSGENQPFKYSLQSKPFHPKSDYVLAYVDKRGFHFSPISTIQQFTPLFDKSSFIGDEEKEAPQASKQRSDMLLKDYKSLKDVRVFNSSTTESQSLCSQLQSPTLESATKGRDSKLEGAEDCLFPPDLYSHDQRDSLIVNRFSSKFPTDQRIQELLVRCQVLPLSLIVAKMNSSSWSVSESQAISSLIKFGFPMHGVWVSFDSSFKGVDDALRGLILSHFYASDDGTVARLSINKLVTCSRLRKCTKDILESIADLNVLDPPSERRWRLRYMSPKEESAAELQKVTREFEKEVAASHTLLRETFNNKAVYSSALGSGRSHSFFNNVSLSARASVKNTLNSKKLLPKDQKIVDDISKALQTVFHKEGVLSKEAVKAKILEDRLAKFPSATPHMINVAIQSSLQQFTVSTWILKQFGVASIDRIRPSIISSVLELKNFSFAELMAHLREKYPSESFPEDQAKHVLAELTKFAKAESKYHIKQGLGT